MRTTIRDRKVLESLSPIELSSYLRSSGWSWQSNFNNLAALWTRLDADGNESETVVPRSRETADFPLRMAEVLATLEKIENRAQEEIVRDLWSTSTDLLRIRAMVPAAADGTVSLRAGVGLVKHSRELLESAACATVSTKAYWDKRRPPQVTGYLDTVRLGQTERGSFVLAIHSPVTPSLLSVEETVAPFERRVMHTLTRSLKAALQAAQQAAENGGFEPFRQAMAEGVNANLCDAAAGLGELSGEGGFDVSIQWSRTRPEPPMSRITFPSEFVPYLREASRRFKTIEPRVETVEGFVERLNRDLGASEGEVMLISSIDEVPRKVSMRLSEAAYALAIQAHSDGIPVSCTGELSREGTHLRLKNPREFALYEPELFLGNPDGDSGGPERGDA